MSWRTQRTGAIVLLAVVALIVALVHRSSRDGAARPLSRGDGGATPEAVGATLALGEASSERALEREPVAPGETQPEGPSFRSFDDVEPPRIVQVVVVTPSGEPLADVLRREIPLAELMLRVGSRPPTAPLVVPGGVLADELTEWRPPRRTLTGKAPPGRFAALVDPPTGALVLVARGDLVLATSVVPAPPLERADDGVTLVVDPQSLRAAFAEFAATLPGEPPLRVTADLVPLDGGSSFAALVRVPVGVRGRVLEARDVLPGRYLLEVKSEVGAFADVLDRQAQGLGLPGVVGGFTLDEAQFDARSKALGELLTYSLQREVELAPGERKDLGMLDAAIGGAVELRLEGESVGPGGANRSLVSHDLSRAGTRSPARILVAARGAHAIGVPPGTYDLLLRARLRGARCTVTVREGEVVRRTARLEPWVSLRVSEAGVPAGASVVLRLDSGACLAVDDLTGAGSSSSDLRVPPGRHTVLAIDASGAVVDEREFEARDVAVNVSFED